MNDPDPPPTNLADDDDIHIVDLDPAFSLQPRRATYLIGLVRTSLATPWIRSGIAALLLLLLLGALLLQLPRPAPSSGPKTPAPLFLSATTTAGLIFIQSTDHTLTASQMTTGHVRWHLQLPAVSSIVAGDQTLYCLFRTAPDHTELEALAAPTGTLLWHDALPAVTASTSTGQFESNGSNVSLAPAFSYGSNALYLLSSSGTVYAIQAKTGHITWTYHAHETQAQSTPVAQPSSFPTQELVVRNGVVAFFSANATLHLLNATTGQELLSLPPGSFPLIDGPIMYLLSPPNASSASIRAFHLPDDRLLWTYPLSTDVSVQAELDGMLYLSAAANSTLIALRGSDGHRLWTYRSSDGQPAADTFVAANDIVGYLLQQDATVVAIRESSGQVLWRTQVASLKNRNYQLFPFTFTLDQGNLVLYPQGPQNSLALPVSVLRESSGHLLWSRPFANTNLIPLGGTLYGLQNNGQLDAWRESDGQLLWSYSAPIGSSIAGSLTEGAPLLFLLDPAGTTFYVLRSTDGKLLWHTP